MALLHLLLMAQGLSPLEAELELTRDGKCPGTIEKLEKLIRVFRMLTVATFNVDQANLTELFGLYQEQSAFTNEDIRKLATPRGLVIRSVIDWINCILLCSSDETMGGWADEQTIVLMAKIIGISDFAFVKPAVANGGDRILQSTSCFSAAVNDMANMVLIHDGHCEAIAPIDAGAGANNAEAGVDASLEASSETGAEASGVGTGAGVGEDTGAEASADTGAEAGADTGAEAGAEHSNTEPPSAEPSVQTVRFVCLGDLAHPNPYDALCDGDGEADDEGEMVDEVGEVDEKQLETENEWLCSKCFVPGEDSGGGDGDEDSDGDISGDDDSGGSGDASGDGSDNKESAKTRASRSPHIDLVEASEEENRTVIKANIDAQGDLAKKKKEARPTVDNRYLTRADVIEAVRAIKAGNAIDDVIMRKMEKEDPRLYGTTVDPVNGTLVTLSGRKGRVVAASRDLDGFVANDPKVKRIVDPVDLEGEKGTEAVELRQFAWREMKGKPATGVSATGVSATGVPATRVPSTGVPATDVINTHEIKLLASDGGLEQVLSTEGYLVEVLDINLVQYSGLVNERKDYAEQHYSAVDHYIKGAQAAYKLGRVISFQSCMASLAAKLSTGGVHDELPQGRS
eukprot:g13958.t1